jgi:iron complex outermembrane receptor protein/vitamin B12 transporter
MIMRLGNFGSVFILLLAGCNVAAHAGELRGTISDPLGALIAHADVALIRDTTQVGRTATNDAGEFAFASLSPGRYRVRATASGFAQQDSQEVYVRSGRSANLSLTLKIASIAQELVVSASGASEPDSRVGASVSVVSGTTIEQKLDTLESLRLIPGAQMLQTGRRGGTTDLFVRGGNANANKVLLDGITVNDIGGAVEFGNIASSAVEQIEILRGPNSVLYGSDALAGVVNLTTRQGTTHLPEINYSVDGGMFGSLRQDAAVSGVRGPIDYLADFSRFDTRNGQPNSAFRNGTLATNFGWSLQSATQIRFTLRRTVTGLGLPGQLEAIGIPDDSFQKEQDTYIGITAQNQTTERWHNLLRYGSTRLRFQFENPSPTGQPFDPFGTGPNFLGSVVTLTGANGFSVTGRAILDFAGTYPMFFNTQSNRNFGYIQSDYRFDRHFSALFAFRYEREDGFTEFAKTKTPTDRKDLAYTGQVQASLWNRFYATAGVGVEKNEIFGVVPTPRASLAFYLARLRSKGFLNGSKLRFNFGKGIKEPAIFDESTSLFTLLSQLPNGLQLANQFHVEPIGAERSRSFDFGLDETAWHGRAKLGLTFFHNEFSDQIEFVEASALTQLGVPAAVVAATPFGASVNSGAFRAIGAETELQVDLGHGLFAKGSYTYLDAVVQRSFTSDALAPLFNPAFPTIPIGNTPLIGDRPFRRAPHSGSFLIGYNRKRFMLTIVGNLVGKRDDSTHALDGFFGTSLLLPNRNLDAAYQKIDLSGSFRINSAVELYSSAENILAQHYDAAFGFPSLPFTVRSGVKFTFGGESWKIR